ncbi:hypothetical protein OESDEN_09363 [Oesophagostomum dentatum]|uniref:Uncharacterized protein n=1 Tax=Oesophagostomum dentatum TaxID=61180 RepID=A0A0B1T3Q9_OESDE|nr:hypothetical protein OESDEN_09363 [Oesophagostomum dentatum]
MVDGIRFLSPARSTSAKSPKENYGDYTVVYIWLDLSQIPDSGETIKAEKYCEQIGEMHKKSTKQPTLQKLNELGYEASSHPPNHRWLVSSTTDRNSPSSTNALPLSALMSREPCTKTVVSWAITLFTVSHRKSLWVHHEYFLHMDGRGSYQFEKIDESTAMFGS